MMDNKKYRKSAEWKMRMYKKSRIKVRTLDNSHYNALEYNLGKIIKALESGQTWFFFDTARSTHNVIDLYLYGQRDLAESTAGTIDIDFLSNGFKIRSSGSDLNSSSGQAYAYLAWADVPFKYNNTF